MNANGQRGSENERQEDSALPQSPTQAKERLEWATRQAGNLYGTTIAGGSPNCQCGIVYKLTPGAGDKWSFKVLHTFVGTDGAQPVGELILDGKGNLYGNTITGGTGGYGVSFELTP